MLGFWVATALAVAGSSRPALKAFYDRLGEEVANELVEWLNLVDSTHRADLRGNAVAARSGTNSA